MSFSLCFFFRTKAVPGRMWIGGWLGWQLKWQWQWHCHWELIHFGHTVFASAPFFWLSAFVRQLAIVWATEIAHSWTSAGGGGENWNPVMLLISPHCSFWSGLLGHFSIPAFQPRLQHPAGSSQNANPNVNHVIDGTDNWAASETDWIQLALYTAYMQSVCWKTSLPLPLPLSTI